MQQRKVLVRAARENGGGCSRERDRREEILHHPTVHRWRKCTPQRKVRCLSRRLGHPGGALGRAFFVALCERALGMGRSDVAAEPADNDT